MNFFDIMLIFFNKQGNKVSAVFFECDECFANLGDHSFSTYANIRNTHQGVINVSFSENYAYVLNELSLVT